MSHEFDLLSEPGCGVQSCDRVTCVLHMVYIRAICCSWYLGALFILILYSRLPNFISTQRDRPRLHQCIALLQPFGELFGRSTETTHLVPGDQFVSSSREKRWLSLLGSARSVTLRPMVPSPWCLIVHRIRFLYPGILGLQHHRFISFKRM